MKSFCVLPLVERDPVFGLHIEDGLPACVDMRGYEGPRGIAEVLSLTSLAKEIKEISEAALALGLGEVRVLRTGGGVCQTSVMAPYDFPCLEERGITIFAISDFDGIAPDNAAGILDRFLWSAMTLHVGQEPRWLQLAFYKALVRRVGARFVMPPRLDSGEEPVLLEPWWQLPVSATTRQIHAFTDRVNVHVPNWKDARSVVMDVHRWLLDYPGEHDNFEVLLSDLETHGPLSRWKLVA